VRLPTNRGVCEMLPDGRSRPVQALGGAEYNAALAARSRIMSGGDRRSARPPVRSTDGRVQETGGAAGWPELPEADGLSQRSLL